MSTTETSSARCTVVVGAPMIRCGAPSVRSWTGRTGGTYAECAAHDCGPIVGGPHTIVAGDRIVVRHGGLDKVGTVVSVRRTLATVEVTVYAGSRREKLVRHDFPFADLRVAS